MEYVFRDHSHYALVSIDGRGRRRTLHRYGSSPPHWQSTPERHREALNEALTHEHLELDVT